MHVKHRLGIDLDTKGGLNVVSQPLLVRLLHSGPFLLEQEVIGMFEETFKLLEILEPLGLWNLESLGD